MAREFTGELDAPQAREFSGSLDAQSSGTVKPFEGEVDLDTEALAREQQAFNEANPFGTRVMQRLERGTKSRLADEHAATAAEYALGLHQMTHPDQYNPIVRMQVGNMSPEDRAAEIDKSSSAIAAHIANYTRLQKEIRDVPVAPVAKGGRNFRDTVRAAMVDPAAYIADVALTSLPGSADALAQAAAGGRIAGTRGAAAGAFFGSSHVDYASEISNFLERHGVDTTNADAVKQAFSDPTLMEQAKKEAGLHAGVVGLFDALSMGAASKVMAPAFKSGIAREAVNIPVQTVAQGALGAAGEAGGQMAARGQVDDPGAVLAEMVGEAAQAPADVAAATAGGVRQIYGADKQAASRGIVPATSSGNAREFTGKLDHPQPAPDVSQVPRETAEAAQPAPAQPIPADTTPVPTDTSVSDGSLTAIDDVAQAPRTLVDNDPLLTDTSQINTPEREQFRQSLVDKAVENVQPSERPVAYIMGGGGAAGKSTLLRKLQARGLIPNENVVEINPDDVKRSIPEFDQIVGKGDSRAAAVVHSESSAIANRIRQAAIDKRANIIIDRTLKDQTKGLREIQQLKDAGYDVHLIGVTVDPNVAVERAKARGKKTGRYVAAEVLRAAHKGFASAFERYARVVDRASLYDTGEGNKLIAKKRVGQPLTVADETGYNLFRERHTENDGVRQEGRRDRAGARGRVTRVDAATGVQRETAPDSSSVSEQRLTTASPAAVDTTATSEETPAEESAPRKTGTGGTFHANPIQVVKEGYERMAQSALDFLYDKVGYKFSPLKDMPAQKTFLKGYYQLLGRLSSVDAITRKVYDTFSKASSNDQASVYAYLTQRDGDANWIQDRGVRERAIAVKRLIDRVGQSLVRHKLLSPEAMEAHRGEYLPRVYLKYVIGDQMAKALGRGLKPGDMGYLKARKDIPAEVRELILGEIKDPGYLASRALGIPMRDMAIIDFFEQIAKNNEWVFPASIVDYNGAKVSVHWLKSEAQRLTEQAKLMQPEARERLLDIVKGMDAAVNPRLEELGKVPDKFKQVPDTKKYGAMRGAYIRREIYDQIIGARESIPNDASIAQKILGFGGYGSKLTAWWKISKVSLNPPAQIRNATSNLALLHLSGVPLHRIPQRLSQAIRSIRTNGRHWRIAKKLGVMESTFAGQEFAKIERQLLDVLSREKEGMTLADLKNLGAKIVDAAGGSYQAVESVFKTAKIIDAMEREGMSESDAGIAAQDALFDYSLVPNSVRYLRSAPVGVPFMTFYYKVFPLLMKTLIKHPQRFLPYAAIPYAISQMIASDYDVDKEDLDKLKLALPKWLQDKGHAMFLPWRDANGRWQALDYGYYLPWSMFADMAGDITSIAKGEPDKLRDLLQHSGVLGGPIPDLIAALKTNQDPFTNRPIANPADPPKYQLASWMNYLWRAAAPTWMTDIGAAGHLYRTLTGHVNPSVGPKFGEQMDTTGQALARFFGINIYPIDPEKTVTENVRGMGFEIEQIRQRMKSKLRDPNLSEDQRDTMRADFMAELEVRAQQLRAYQDAANFNPRLLGPEKPNGKRENEEGVL